MTELYWFSVLRLKPGSLRYTELIASILEASKGTLEISSVVCWLGSQIVLWWIWDVDQVFKKFVQNRVIEVRRLLSPENWNYCSFESNPADKVTAQKFEYKYDM